jgi:hypothetical protein
MEFLSDYPFHRPLPLELNCEIFKCLAEPIQTKFIWAMGRDIYAAFLTIVEMSTIIIPAQFYIILKLPECRHRPIGECGIAVGFTVAI